MVVPRLTTSDVAATDEPFNMSVPLSRKPSANCVNRYGVMWFADNTPTKGIENMTIFTLGFLPSIDRFCSLSNLLVQRIRRHKLVVFDSTETVYTLQPIKPKGELRIVA